MSQTRFNWAKRNIIWHTTTNPTMQYVHDERAFPPRFFSEVSGSEGFLEVASIPEHTELRADKTL